MKIVKSFFGSYLRTFIFFVIAFYATTAPPTGAFKLTWNLLNGYLVTAFVLLYPLMILLVPFLRLNPATMFTVGTHSLRAVVNEHQSLDELYKNAINPVASRDLLLSKNEYRDDMVSMAVGFLLQGVLLLLSGPLLVVVGIIKGILWLRHH